MSNFTHPGYQRKANQSWTASSPIYWLIFIVSALFIQAFAHENLDYQQMWGEKLWDLKILKTSEALTTIVALFALVITREQIALAVSPILVYDCYPVKKPADQSTLQVDGGEYLWKCVLKNIGSGVAIFESTYFQITFSEGPNVSYTYSYAEVVEKLAARGIELGRDFSLIRFSEGGCIAANSEFVVLEMTPKCIAQFKNFDLRLRFKGRLGDRYSKELFCIPREFTPEILNSKSATS